MDPGDAIHLLERLGVLSHPSDLDLLLFFAKHPHCLLRSETLAAFLGYEAKVIAESLDVLLAAGVLTRAQTPAHAARLYVLAAPSPTNDWVPTVIAAASTRVGRLALRRAIAQRGRPVGIAAPRGQSIRLGPRRLSDAESDQDQSHTG